MKALPPNLMNLGVGLGFREQLRPMIATHDGEIDFYELIGDTLFDDFTLEETLRATAGRPVVCHFLAASLATAGPLDPEYLEGIKRVSRTTGCLWVSDHLAITSVFDHDIGHLTPPILDNSTLNMVADKIKRIQDVTGRIFLIENISYLFMPPGAEMSEADFLQRLCTMADCGLLLDLNNLHVNASNHDFNPYEFLMTLPLDRVLQVHIAGSAWSEDLLIDTHADPVPASVFELLGTVRARGGAGAVLLERDRNFPPDEELISELRKAREVWKSHAIGEHYSRDIDLVYPPADN
ncbi:MAG: DUF692 domain-containing protein [Alphaproteobacteria bacterium]|nr:DUF692 domain-containing protein [Alphaproteobacteria bacterium]MBU0804979.1 DUF692 domain-containing protein [Alphaproteobacteria bacterium]MBU0870478.1 DUF692 domain-containing protein [Alphaproteobacteria bacterium]MBU1401847.1 DUF692 domain-containing protein [Alphaproteobacteria bacterium]MBU1591736.1 DUF692 domain-containing protein [Alphaproteobacteria bacterium]